VIGVVAELTSERAKDLVWEAIKEVGLDKSVSPTEDLEDLLSKLGQAIKRRLGCTKISVRLMGGVSVANTPPAEIRVECEIDKPDVYGRFEYSYTFTGFAASYELEGDRASYRVDLKPGAEGWFPVLSEEEAYVVRKEKR
jgi:hypothetical protein